jgi:hypothetical protein
MLFYAKVKLVAAGIVLLALLGIPAPLLPPHRFAEAMQSMAGISWNASYLLSAILLRAAFYGALGLVGAFAVSPAKTLRGRLLQIILLPLAFIAVALVVRSVKGGHLPMLGNVAIPMAACLIGVLLGIGVLYRRGKITLVIAAVIIGAALRGFVGGTSTKLSRDTEANLQRPVAAGPTLPLGGIWMAAISHGRMTRFI